MGLSALGSSAVAFCEAVPLDSCVSVTASASVRLSVSALAHEGLDQSQLGMDAVQRNQRNTQKRNVLIRAKTKHDLRK